MCVAVRIVGNQEGPVQHVLDQWAVAFRYVRKEGLKLIGCLNDIRSQSVEYSASAGGQKVGRDFIRELRDRPRKALEVSVGIGGYGVEDGFPIGLDKLVGHRRDRGEPSRIVEQPGISE